jgi:hypothetical protein
MKFVKENKISKEWKTMKLTVDFENGMVLTLKPENISLIDNGGKDTVAITRTDNAVIPLVFFNTLLATPAELKAREVAAKAAAEAETKATTPTSSDAGAAAVPVPSA